MIKKYDKTKLLKQIYENYSFFKKLFFISSVPEIMIDELHLEKQQKITHIFVDLRESSEIVVSVIPNTILLNHFQTEFLCNPYQFSNNLMKLVFVCSSGIRSSIYLEGFIKMNKKFLKEIKFAVLVGGIKAYCIFEPMIDHINFREVENEYYLINDSLLQRNLIINIFDFLRFKLFHKTIYIETPIYIEIYWILLMIIAIFSFYYLMSYVFKGGVSWI